MKNRLIVAAIGIPALLAVIFFTPIWGWGIVVAIMAAFCAWELLHTAMPKFVPRFAVYAGVCGAAIVLGAAFGKSELVFKIAAYVLFVTMFTSPSASRFRIWRSCSRRASSSRGCSRRSCALA